MPLLRLQPSSGWARWRLVSPRRRLLARRRSIEPLVGREARRGGGGGAIASRSSAARRSRAATRFCRCERDSAATRVRTLPFNRDANLRSRRSRCTSSRAAEPARSKDNWTLESVVLTPWPPGPDACDTARPTPGPGSPVLHACPAPVQSSVRPPRHGRRPARPENKAPR